MDDLETLSQTERAYRRLRNEILHGDLMPGERLRANDLQDRFQLGLTPIREALTRLSSENFVASRPIADRGSAKVVQEDAYETVLRDALALDHCAVPGVYFGTRSGKVYASSDAGDAWSLIAGGLPPVVCVKAAVVA